MAPRVGLEPTTLRLRGFLPLPEGSDYLITRTWKWEGVGRYRGLSVEILIP